jgi:hypothetical protein
MVKVKSSEVLKIKTQIPDESQPRYRAAPARRTYSRLPDALALRVSV